MRLLLSRDVRYYEPEHWKFGEVGNKYFRHATGQLYAISKDLAAYISLNKWDIPYLVVCFSQNDSMTPLWSCFVATILTWFMLIRSSQACFAQIYQRGRVFGSLVDRVRCWAYWWPQTMLRHSTRWASVIFCTQNEFILTVQFTWGFTLPSEKQATAKFVKKKQ